MLDELYNSKILFFAGNIAHIGKLDQPHITDSLTSQLCGSKISVDLVVENAVVVDFAQRVEACALGQASASIVSQVIIGARLKEIMTARNELSAMLAGEDMEPTGRFSDLKFLRPVRDHPSRHASTLLILDAILKATKNIAEADINQARIEA